VLEEESILDDYLTMMIVLIMMRVMVMVMVMGSGMGIEIENATNDPYVSH
jgi:hypothetical protein